jgi:autotransporter passenger strand-loop-strand repeat protein
MTTIGFGQSAGVNSGETVSGWIVRDGGILDVLSGGTAIDTLLIDGILNVSSGGSTTGTNNKPRP